MGKTIVGALTALAGLLSMLGAWIGLKFSWITIVVMCILNALGVIKVAWFAWAFTAGAITTGLWMFVGGMIMLALGALLTALGAAIIDG